MFMKNRLIKSHSFNLNIFKLLLSVFYFKSRFLELFIWPYPKPRDSFDGFALRILAFLE